MSSSNRPVPVYNQACIASDSSRDQTSFYLAGSSQPGHLTVDYFNNFESPPAPTPVATQADQHAWDTNAKKLCFTRPNQQLANPLPPGTNPIDSNQALLAVGTYGLYNTTASQGYTTVFDKSGEAGQIQTAAGSLPSGAGNGTQAAVTLGAPMPVNMNGIKLTADAIPVTMETIGYILDKADNGSTVVYSINPSNSSTLNRVYAAGDSLPFSSILAASALYNGILTYSSNRTVASFNVFNIKSGKWSGDGLVSAAVVDPNPKPSAPIAAIIGGVVGGLLVIALAMFFFFRRRRQSAQKSADNAELAQLNSDENKIAGFDQGYVQYDHGYVQYDQGYQHTPTFFPPPPPPINQGADESYKVDAAASPTNPYVSPTSYRESISHSPESPESLFSKSVKSTASHGPQYVPNNSIAASDARSPQAVSSTTDGA
ncbi:hypothetical protein BG015_000665 [Linnemannia schmuckeri]|uniref:Uncharacterized protein n=1 Tax=Linnemannia schmuckeri TaxID=64567 RepID=A0A9P5V6Y8_9FUNG|nr:hypothetical protein BG015_000665 [Linnemannia schmuckeri]